jgi:DNA repair exonuclease SbcCD ATPase subunit
MDEREDVPDPVFALQTALERLHRGTALIGEAREAAQHTMAAATQVVEALQPLPQVVASLRALARNVDACVSTMAQVDLLARLDTIALMGRAIQTAVQEVAAGSAALPRQVQDLLETHAGESQAFLIQRLAEAVSRLHDLVVQHIDTTTRALTAQLEASIQAAQHTTSQQVTALQTQCTQLETLVHSIQTAVPQVRGRLETLEHTMHDTLDALTDRLETQRTAMQHELTQQLAALQTQLAHERTTRTYLSIAALAVGVLTIGLLVFMR